MADKEQEMPEENGEFDVMNFKAPCISILYELRLVQIA